MDDNTKGHNAKARAAAIRNAFRALDEIEKHIAPLKAQAADLKKEIRENLGIKGSHFTLARKLYLLEKEERDEISDVIRESFEALGVGQQSSFLPILEHHSSDAEFEEEDDEDAMRDEPEEPDDPGDENDEGPRTDDIDIVPL